MEEKKNLHVRRGGTCAAWRDAGGRRGAAACHEGAIGQVVTWRVRVDVASAC